MLPTFRLSSTSHMRAKPPICPKAFGIICSSSTYGLKEREHKKKCWVFAVIQQRNHSIHRTHAQVTHPMDVTTNVMGIMLCTRLRATSTSGYNNKFWKQVFEMNSNIESTEFGSINYIDSKFSKWQVKRDDERLADPMQNDAMNMQRGQTLN